jgi:hypothetical protein
MSTVTRTRGVQSGGSSEGTQSFDGGGLLRRRVSILISVVVLGWSILELASLLSRHTTGPELYGVAVAGVAVAAGFLNLVLFRSKQRRLWAIVVVLALWSLVALGGLAGTIAHIVGPVAGHGPVDLRPRPVLAPLVFTLLGLAGGAALWFGQRRRGRPAHELREE